MKSVLILEAQDRIGMTIAEFKAALRKAEQEGFQDNDIIRVDVFAAFSANGSPVRRVYIPIGENTL